MAAWQLAVVAEAAQLALEATVTLWERIIFVEEQVARLTSWILALQRAHLMRHLAEQMVESLAPQKFWRVPPCTVAAEAVEIRLTLMVRLVEVLYSEQVLAVVEGELEPGMLRLAAEQVEHIIHTRAEAVAPLGQPMAEPVGPAHHDLEPENAVTVAVAVGLKTREQVGLVETAALPVAVAVAVLVVQPPAARAELEREEKLLLYSGDKIWHKKLILIYLQVMEPGQSARAQF